MKYAHTDGAKNILGWYDKGVHSSIPTPSIEVTEEQWETAINSGHNKVYADGSTALVETIKTALQIEDELKAHFKALYLGVFRVKLAELDYDGIDTVTMWANRAGSTFQVEAQSLLDWYAAIIDYNYALLTAGAVPTDTEYLAGLPVL